MNCFEGIQHYPEFGRFPYTSLYSCPDISPVNMQQGFSRSEFGSVEMGFLKLFLQNLSFSLPFVNHSILTNGINSICLQNSSSLPSDVASVSLTWCCCGFGALLSFRNDHAVEYLKKARKSIQICFDNANDLIGRAYLAIDMLMRNTNIDGEKDIFLRETYLNFGKAILNSVEQTSIDEATRVICEHIRAWDVVKLASDCRLDLNNSVRLVCVIICHYLFLISIIVFIVEKVFLPSTIFEDFRWPQAFQRIVVVFCVLGFFCSHCQIQNCSVIVISRLIARAISFDLTKLLFWVIAIFWMSISRIV